MNSRILYWNANGLMSRKDDLTSLLTCPQPMDNEPPIDIVALVETHVRPGAICPRIHGYNTWSLEHMGNSGGVAIYARDTLVASDKPALNYVDGACAVLWIAVRPFPRSRAEVLVAAVYIQPGVVLTRVKALLDSIRHVVETHKTQPMIITGDFNSRDPLWGDTVTSMTAPTVKRFLTASGLLTLNQSFIPGRCTRPSRDPQVASSVIDLAMTNKPALIASMSIADEYGLYSDHLPILIEIARRPIDMVMDGPANHLGGHRVGWQTRMADWDRFAQQLGSSIMAHSLTSPIPLPNGGRSAQSIIDERWRHVHRVLMEVAHVVVGVKTQRKNSKYWWACPLVNVNAVYKAYRKSITRCKRSPLAKQVAAREARRVARKAYKNALWTAKEWANSELLRQMESCPHVLNWSGYRRALPRTERVSLTSVTNESGALPLNTHESLFNFTTALSRSAVPPHRSPAHDVITARVASAAQQYIANPSEDTLNWSCTTSDVERLCTHIAVGRAYGSDHVHPAFLRYGGREFYAALCELFNYSYRHSVVPLQWTQSLVVPLYKDGDKTSANSYRPISLTSCIMRTMEHLIQERLIALVSDRLHPYQYGFRPRHSTYNAIHHMLEDLHTTARTSPKSTIPVVFLDLRKAFDRVWHDGLLDMLRRRGVRGRIWLWLRAFISNRCSCVVNNGSSSGWFLQRYGVPQGAVLSPVLFNIFFDSLAEALTSDPRTPRSRLTILKYADDAALYPDVRVYGWRQRLQDALDITSAWARHWCMEFNPKKSQLVYFTRRRAFHPVRQYRLSGFNLEVVSSYRYLGLHLSEDYHWSKHIGELVRRASHDAFLVRRLIDHRSDRSIHFGTVRSITNSHLLPRWTYGLALMPNTLAVRKWLFRAESELCSTIRAILGLPRSTHKVSVLVEAGLRPMTVYADYQRLRMAHNMSQLPLTHATATRYATGLRDARADNTYWSTRIAAGQTTAKQRDRGDPAHIQSFYRTLLLIQTALRVLHQSIDDVARKVVIATYAYWAASRGGAVLKSIRHYCDSRHVGKSQYLYADTAIHARTRAAFRLDRIQSNGSMYRMNHGRAGTTSTPDCACCPGVEESIPHIINDCPLYAMHRHIVSRTASTPVGPSFVAFVLGGMVTGALIKNAARAAARSHELRLTGDFLVSTLTTRGVPAR